MSRRKVKRALGIAFAGTLACREDSAFGTAQAQEARRIGAVTAETTYSRMRGRYALYEVKLRGRDGLAANGRLLRPARSRRARHPAVLLQDGRELNSRAIDFLPREFGDVVVLSLDYPEELPYEIQMRQFFGESERLRRAARRIPPMFSLGAEYLTSRTDVDGARLTIVATSFAVPFAVSAAARDRRFVDVGLVYGAGKMHEVLAANLRLRPAWLRRAVAWVAMRPFGEFAPERHVARIAPRPIVMVNGVDDPQMPRRSVKSLYDAAREPKTLIWLRTGHLMPDDSVLVRALVDTVLARLPSLHGVLRQSLDSGETP